nr:competence protein CoiA family protein [Periweissella cryptocerci]
MDNQLIEANFAVAENKYFCPGCKCTVMLKRGVIKAPHFAHLSGARCETFSEGETNEHLQGKIQLRDFFAAEYEVQLEATLPAISQRPDLLVKKPNGKLLAIEYQCSAISLAKLRQRTAGYRQQGIQVLWILGSTYVNRKMTNPTLAKFMTVPLHGQPFVLFWENTHRRFCLWGNIAQPDFQKREKNITYATNLTEYRELMVAIYQKQETVTIGTSLRLKAALKLQQLVSQNRGFTKYLQQVAYQQHCHLGGVTWLAHPKVQLPIGLKMPHSLWRAKFLLELQKYRPGERIANAQLLNKLLQPSDWYPDGQSSLLPTKQLIVRNFWQALIQQNIIEPISATHIRLNRHPVWYPDYQLKIAGLKKSE